MPISDIDVFRRMYAAHFAAGYSNFLPQIANAAPVELPPAVTDSGIYRCKDNSVVYVDFLGDKTEANVRTSKEGTPTHVKAEAADKPMTGGNGFSVSGSGKTVQIAVNGGAAQSCNR